MRPVETFFILLAGMCAGHGTTHGEPIYWFISVGMLFISSLFSKRKDIDKHEHRYNAERAG